MSDAEQNAGPTEPRPEQGSGTPEGTSAADQPSPVVGSEPGQPAFPEAAPPPYSSAAQPTYPGAAQPTYPGAAQPTYPGAQPQPTYPGSPAATYPGSPYQQYPPYPTAPARSVALPVTLSVIALVVGVFTTLAMLGFLALTSTASGSDLSVLLGFSVIVGGFGLLVTLALAIPALFVARRRKHTPSTVLSAAAGLSALITIALIISVIATATSRPATDSGSPYIQPTPSAPSDDAGTAPDAGSDPSTISWDNGALAGSTAPSLDWDPTVQPSWSASGDTTNLLATNADTACTLVTGISALPDATTAADDESRSVADLMAQVSGVDSGDLWDLDLFWYGAGEANGLTLVMAETSDDSSTTLTAYRALNSAAVQLSYVITCPGTGDDGITAVESAHNEVWDAITVMAG